MESLNKQMIEPGKLTDTRLEKIDPMYDHIKNYFRLESKPFDQHKNVLFHLNSL